MENLSTPVVEAQMMIRKPVSMVFEAFIDPEITTHFWFTKSAGRLEVGKSVVWQWEMYGASTEVFVKEIVPGRLIATEWGNPKTNVDYHFYEMENDRTYIVIKNYGFKQTGDDLVAIIKDQTGGFTTVLDGAKAWLEHNIQLNLIGDKFPKEASEYF